VLLRDLADDASELWLAMLVALIASMVPYGYLVGMVVGTVLAAVMRRGR